MKTIKMRRPQSSVRPHARELLERRAERLLKLLRLDAPDIMLAAEVGLLAQAVQTLAPQPVRIAARG